MGTQGMAEHGARAGIEVLRSGAIGPVREMHVWTDRAQGWWPQGVESACRQPPVPSGLDWDLWLGTAPRRPYHPAYVPFAWRGWLDFGTGAIGDMGIHNAAMAWLGLELGLPQSAEVVATSGMNRRNVSGMVESCVWSFPRAVRCRPSRCTGTTGASSRRPH